MVSRQPRVVWRYFWGESIIVTCVLCFYLLSPLEDNGEPFVKTTGGALTPKWFVVSWAISNIRPTGIVLILGKELVQN